MKKIRTFHSLLPVFLITCSLYFCNGIPDQTGVLNPQQQKQLVGNCEGCEAVFEFGDRNLSHELVLPDYEDQGPKIHILGTVYKAGGKEPAENVILYVYHTDQTGVYPKTGDETGWGKRHGYIRGWLKTDEQGNFLIKTLIPGAYPGGGNPKHIHITVLEPDGRYYWIDDFLFNEDPYLTQERKDRSDPRGGPGFVLKPVRKGDMLTATRTIELGKNVEGYRP